MIFASVLKQLLVLFRYPRNSDTLSGPHAVGATKVRLHDTTASCQIHYPTEQSSSSSGEFRSYFRPEAVEGMADYARSDPRLLAFLSAKRHPCDMDANPISNDDDKKFPLVLFSHGIAGCMEMYTQLCMNVASHGFIVVALEHEDGSGCYAETAEGEPIYYKRPDDTPYSREKVLTFRGPMLAKRVGEIERVMEYFLSSSSSTADNGEQQQAGGASSLLDKIVAATDTSQGVSLLGHSFGAATMALVEQRLASSASSSKQINSVAILDPWCFALPDTALQKGIVTAPVLSVLSEDWTTNRETAQALVLLENSSRDNIVASLWAPGTVHQSFSDTNSWLPSFVAKKMVMRGAEEERFETPREVAKTCASHFERSLSSFGEDDAGGNGANNNNLETGATLKPFTKTLKEFTTS
mmetsp:Transcript_30607/g.50548  ORF Transcript_30607/g.50548 Transcript_30607/m.50548 type:complete len:411 (-) Transcript_30607:236-1468(-)|eukprot:CAMPEP_0119011636 /NCGR_PEP_ID=MMETSP1176-20130426/5800_1 /TAXON_ID=265551 /ORGANISM="Synedropsis recta cf, Strain CCMP1620" /LENGTH=410 /DNA_ID=CAMNT_0006964491 /DNA_START=109 /DNA_END=1341 /DNA_ORIENTATION=+